MTELWLTLRRLWWFVADHKTPLRFAFPCPKCGQSVVFFGSGFRFPQFVEHNAWCEFRRGLQILRHTGWLFCRRCWDARFIVWTCWVKWRWAFRLKYNWGYGVPVGCRMGIHDWVPGASYREGTADCIHATCRVCGFSHRWVVEDVHGG